jgi:hypothetical protein
MTPRFRRTTLAIVAAALVVAFASAAPAQTTICDTDPNAVPFEATVDPSGLNFLLSLLGNINVPPPNPPPALDLQGICVTHRLPITLPSLVLPLASQANIFTVQTSLGRVQANLDLNSPFNLEIDGSNYQAVNCRCEVPYVGQFPCDIEAGIVGPLLGLVVDVGMSWDALHVSQVADTCVLGDCTPVHPLTSTDVTLTNFDVDATGFGNCGFCFPAPIDFLGCINPCDGFDPLITSLVRPAVEGAVESVFGVPPGLLIGVFSQDIIMDGCAEIPEVRECKNPTTPATGQIREPRDYGVNWALYSLPLVFSVGLTLRLRRRVL